MIDASSDDGSTMQRFEGIRALLSNARLKRSPEPSHTDGLIRISRRSRPGPTKWNPRSRSRRFRSHFVGKVSPVHFFWGSMDLACTRFSGRDAPEHPGGAPNAGEWVMVEGYSKELFSRGFRAAAEHGAWDRDLLEDDPSRWDHVRRTRSPPAPSRDRSAHESLTNGRPE